MKSTRRTPAILLTVVFSLALSLTALADDQGHYDFYNTWTPDKGRSTWAHTVNHQHTLYMYFYWYSLVDLERLRDDGNETLEVDYTLNDSWGTPNGPAWAFNYTGDTKGTHWDTNQSNAYRDTQAFEEFGSRSFTVGTAFAGSLQPATWYYWWVGATHNSEGSRAGISAQHGYRSGDCGSGYANCVFADATINIVWWQNDKPEEFRIPNRSQCQWFSPRIGGDPCAAW